MEKLLLHSCCGPCSTAVLEQLRGQYAPTLYFDNPNIGPESEYWKRLESQRLVTDNLIEAPYDPTRFLTAIAGLEQEPEGGLRCTRCFTLRLEETARLAVREGFPYFTTTLTVSPHKDAAGINQIGAALGEAYGVTYLARDFKRDGGYQRSVALSKELGLYRQTYCGCVFSQR
ncbi:MAG: epoxyqueuosine reductase QueH [Oscillospiraceae bacterium]|nr:epoxyqueuosine reductase QueH [Oscillospiraceae bacterium]